MTDYLDKSGLQVDAQLVTFVENEALPGTGIAPDAYLDRACRAGRAVHAAQSRAAGHARRAAGARSTTGTASMARWRAIRRATRRSCGRSAISLPEPADFTIETTGLDPGDFDASAGRSSSCRCPMRATRSTPPMRAGAVALRCALRHRRDLARGRAGAGQGLQPGARRGRGRARGRSSSTRRFRSPRAASAM